MTTQALDLTAFCDATYPRLAVPFVVNEKRYATDTRIAVEVDAAGEPDVVTTGNRYQDPPKSITDIFTQFKSDAAMEPWPEPDTVDGALPCPDCERIECPDCDGEGSVECDLGHDHDCDRCDGAGVLPNKKCATCNGKLEITGPAEQRVCGMQVAIKYDQMIRALPSPVLCAARNEDLIQFTFDGGRGILMALRSKDARR